MSQESIKYKRAPSIRCRIRDLNEGYYNEEDKGIFTIFGIVRRARIVGNLVYKKVTTTEEGNSEDSMIKTQDGENTKITLLINDGSSLLWINLWGIEPDNYKNMNVGDLIQVIGTVKKNNGRINIYPNILSRYENPNFETLHLLEMIKYIKENEKKSVNITQKDEEITEEDINSFIKSEIRTENPSGDPQSFSDEFDDFDAEEVLFDEGEIEEIIYEIIRNSDKGDGVSIDIILNNSGIKKDDAEETLRKLSLNTKIYSTSNGNFKIYI